jgi:hypothetical protein
MSNGKIQLSEAEFELIKSKLTDLPEELFAQ